MSHRRKRVKQPAPPPPVLKQRPIPVGAIKIRLDARTVITVASQKALDFWKEKYPNATVIE